MVPKGIGPERVKFVGPPVDQGGRLRKRELPVGRAESLSTLADEWAFFTPAVLYLHGQFTDAPLIDFMWEQGEDIPVFYRKFSKPIFKGLEAPSNGNPDWNHALWAVRRADWQMVSDFICSVALAWRDDQELFHVGEQEFPVVDPLAVERTGFYHRRLPCLPVTAFGLSGSKFVAGFYTGVDPLMTLPTLRFFPPPEREVVFARAYFDGTNPVLARDDERHHQRVKEALETLHEDQTDPRP